MLCAGVPPDLEQTAAAVTTAAAETVAVEALALGAKVLVEPVVVATPVADALPWVKGVTLLLWSLLLLLLLP